MMNHPNIVYMHSHDTGRYVQPYGHAVATPRLQQLAEQGVLFRQNFCVNPTCSPSRACLLTGSYPHENGMLGLAHRGFRLNDYGQHLVHTLRGAGYTSALAGVQHVAADQGDQAAWQIIGYDRYLGDAPDAHTQVAAFLGEQHAQPFFLSVGFFETHREFPALDEAADDPRYCLPPAPLPDTPETRADMARYNASARMLDDKIGTVLDAVARNGLADRTLIICTTDHGLAFPRMKCHLLDSGTGVLLIMRGPGSFSGGKIVDAMTSHLDIFPTICDMLQIDRPAWLRGESLLPLVNGEVAALHEELFATVNYHAAYEPQRSVRTERWKYIRRFSGRSTPALPNCDDGPSKTLWLEHGWANSFVADEMLFDLLFDPNEANNLADDPAYNEIRGDMRQRLERWMQETGDPLLHGPVPAPAGVRLNDPNGRSPTEPPVAVAG